MAETFYDVLGVGRDATQSEIESAYRERVKETHPDLNDAPNASDAFQRVQAAEEVLGNLDERARYDRLGHAAYTGTFGDATGDDGAGWDLGQDRTAGESTEDVGGFGFDPGAYDKTGRAGGSGRSGDGNPSQRSYDVSGASEHSDSAAADGADVGGGAKANANANGFDVGDTGAGGTAGRSTQTGTRAGPSSASARTQARQTKREWTKAAQRNGRTDRSEGLGGYAVDDWDEDELETEPTRYSLQGSEIVVIGIMFVLYPFMAYSAVTPAFSLFVNVVVALCALALTGYLLTMPRVGFYVFGSWSVLAPVVVFAFPGLSFLSLTGIVIVGAAWIPFGYSVLFLQVLE